MTDTSDRISVWIRVRKVSVGPSSVWNMEIDLTELADGRGRVHLSLDAFVADAPFRLADAACEQQGLKQGTAELAKCVVRFRSARRR